MPRAESPPPRSPESEDAESEDAESEAADAEAAEAEAEEAEEAAEAEAEPEEAPPQPEPEPEPEPEERSPRRPPSAASSRASAFSGRSSGRPWRKTVPLRQVREPVREPVRAWPRRARRVLTLLLACVAYACWLWNMGALGKELKPRDCSRDGGPTLSYCARHEGLDTCVAKADKPPLLSFHEQCSRDWVRQCTELFVVLFILSLSYTAMLGELTMANAKEDDSGRIQQTKVKWARVAGYIWTVLVLFLLLTLPAVFSMREFRTHFDLSPQTVGTTAAMVFSVLAVMFTLREIMKHLLNWSRPTLQVHVIWVLLMVVVYAVDSLTTLLICSRSKGCEDPGKGTNVWVIVLELLREWYEAFTIYSFFKLLQEALRLEADLWHDRRGSESALDSLEALGVGRASRDLEASLLGGREGVDGEAAGGEEDEESLAARISSMRSSRLLSIVGLEGQPQDVVRLHAMLKHEVDDRARKHSCCCVPLPIKAWRAGYPWLEKCRTGILQYVVVQICCATLILISKTLGIYGEPGYGGDGDGACGSRSAAGSSGAGGMPIDEMSLHADSVYPYTAFIISASQMYALYCLVHFYIGIKDILAEIRPGAKFVSIKLIVFFSYWQSLAITLWFSDLGKGWLLEQYGLDNGQCWLFDNFHLSVGSFAPGANSLLVCIEMFMFSIVHRTVFSYRAFRAPRGAAGAQLGQALLPSGRHFVSSIQSPERRGGAGQSGAAASSGRSSQRVWGRRPAPQQARLARVTSGEPGLAGSE